VACLLGVFELIVDSIREFLDNFNKVVCDIKRKSYLKTELVKSISFVID
jgi:hypothetical protein